MWVGFISVISHELRTPVNAVMQLSKVTTVGAGACGYGGRSSKVTTVGAGGCGCGCVGCSAKAITMAMGAGESERGWYMGAGVCVCVCVCVCVVGGGRQGLQWLWHMVAVRRQRTAHCGCVKYTVPPMVAVCEVQCTAHRDCV